MTLGRLTIFCDCSLSTSLAHLSTTVLGQAFMCVAAATLALEGLVGMDGWTKKQRSRGSWGSWVACGLRLFDGPLSEDRDCAPGRCWASLAPGKCYCFGKVEIPPQSSRHRPAASRPSRQIGTLAIAACQPPRGSTRRIPAPTGLYHRPWQGAPIPIDAG